MLPVQESSSAQVFRKYIENKQIVIADPGATARQGLFHILKELGAKPQNITLVNQYEDAEAQIQEKRPHVVLADYDLGQRCGLDLFQSQRSQHPQDSKKCLFIIVTSNSSQSAVARSCEEDIDAYILKPFTPDAVRTIIMKSAVQKIQPSEYQLLIEQGKESLEKKNYDEAELLFKKAKGQNPSPTTACYYLGQVSYLKKVTDQSKIYYEEGLNLNKIHYRCLVGLYDLLISKNDQKEAYKIVKRISQYFPANPKRLAEVLKLAIVTQQYDDIEKYYSLFTNLDQRDETLIRYVCAALVICSKHYLEGKVGQSRAIELLHKAAATAGGRTRILREIILTLADHSLAQDAEHFLGRFPPEHQAGNDYAVLKFVVSQCDPTSVPTPELGRKLLRKGIVDERLYQAIVEGFLRKGKREDAQDTVIEASNKFPAKKAEFETLLKA